MRYMHVYRPGRPGWRRRRTVILEAAGELLVLLGTIAVLLGVFIAATVMETPR